MVNMLDETESLTGSGSYRVSLLPVEALTSPI